MEQKYRILIVDDEQSILDMLKLQLEFENYIVYTATNAKDALENLSYSPDIILLDINMEGMNGLDLCASIREFISVPIIFLTARVSEQDKVNGLMVGGDDYITKPFSIINKIVSLIGMELNYSEIINIYFALCKFCRCKCVLVHKKFLRFSFYFKFIVVTILVTIIV